MKIKHRQPTSKNCGIYALANILNEDCFVKAENLTGGEDGHRMEELNSLIKKEGFDFFADPIFVDRTKLKLPNDFELFPTAEDKIIPGLMTVRCVGNQKWHCIGIRLYSDKTVRVFDSLCEQTTLTDWKGIIDMFTEIESVYCFTFYDKKIEGYVCLE